MVHTDPVPLPPFRMIGARQDFGIGRKGSNWPNRYGQGLSYLFNRPPDLVVRRGRCQLQHPIDLHRWRTASPRRLRKAWGSGLRAAQRPGRQRPLLEPGQRAVGLLTAAAPLVDHVHLIDPADFVDASGEPPGSRDPGSRIEHPPQHTRRSRRRQGAARDRSTGGRIRRCS